MTTRIGRRWHPNEKGEAVEIVDPPASRKGEVKSAETVLDVPASEAAEEPEDGGEGLRDHPGISNGDVAQVRAYVAAHIALVSGFMDRFEDRLSPWVLEPTRHHMESALDHTERLIAAVQVQWNEEDLGTEEKG